MLKTAAAIARTFRLDPVWVLEERDRFKWLVRVAAVNHIADVMERANKKKE